MSSQQQQRRQQEEEEWQRRRREQAQEQWERMSESQRREILRRQQRLESEMQEKLSRHVEGYPVRLSFPPSAPKAHEAQAGGREGEGGGAAAAAASKPKPLLRTTEEFVQNRLVESGVPFEETAELGVITEAVSRFADDLKRTGCYESARVMIGRASAAAAPAGSGGLRGGGEEGDEPRQQAERRQLDVILEEKNWYRLYVGGGFGAKDLSSSSGGGSVSSASAGGGGGGGGGPLGGASFDVPSVRLETTASLLNLTGACDVTSASYSVDQTGAIQLGMTHDRPLYAAFPRTSPYRAMILNHPTLFNGTRTGLRVYADTGTDDHERTRSCRERHRTLGVRMTNRPPGAPLGGGLDGPLRTLDWSAALRDVMPRRHPSLPYACDASPEVVAQAGTSLKHAVSMSYSTEGMYCDDRFNPTVGFDARGRVEVAGPPGDVGFVKLEGGGAVHVPLGGGSGGGGDDSGGSSGGNVVPPGGPSLHLSGNVGFLHPLTFGGLCPPATALPDRFHLGGPSSLRGFLPSGVGPRSSAGGRSVPGGDALGGDFYCSALTAVSVPFPAAGGIKLNEAGVRLLGFVNAGTLTGGLPLGTTLGSSLLGGAAGVGGAYVSPLDAARSVRVSVGVGATGGLPGGMGRFELTYAVPLRYGPRDARRRVQFGMGMTFG